MDSSSLNSAELQQFLDQEKKKAMLNEMVAKITHVCWDKCVTGTPGTRLNRLAIPPVLQPFWALGVAGTFEVHSIRLYAALLVTRKRLFRN